MVTFRHFLVPRYLNISEALCCSPQHTTSNFDHGHKNNVYPHIATKKRRQYRLRAEIQCCRILGRSSPTLFGSKVQLQEKKKKTVSFLLPWLWLGL